MNLLNIFTKTKQSDQAEKYTPIIADTVEPLDLNSYNLHSKGGRPKSLSDAQVIQIMLWKSEKISNREIAKRLRVSNTTIGRYLKSLKSN